MTREQRQKITQLKEFLLSAGSAVQAMEGGKRAVNDETLSDVVYDTERALKLANEIFEEL